MNGMVKINNTELQVKEYMGQRVVTFKDIDECHEKAFGSAKRRFNNNKQHFEEGIDFFEISKKDVGDDFAPTYGFNDKAPKGYLIAESGYMMLVKSFTDDLAWEVQRMLVNSYFQKHDKLQDDPNKALIAQSKIMNAKARVASIWLKLSDRAPIGDAEYPLICNSYASEVLIGQKVLPLPACNEHFYSATEIAKIVGSSANMVGKIAKKAGVRPKDENEKSENGKWFFDKSQHSSKEVSVFKYNEKGLNAIKVLFEGGAEK